MFGKGVFQEEENLLRDIIRSIDKKVDYSSREGEGTKFSIHIKLRGHEGAVVVDLAGPQGRQIRYGQTTPDSAEN